MTQTFYIGTYTHKTSQGVYRLTLDEQTPKLADAEFVVKAGNPTYIAESAAGRLYIVNKETVAGQMQGGLLVAEVGDGQADVIQSILMPGSSPAYVTVDEDRQLVYTANYHTGAVTVYAIAADGTLSQVAQIVDQDPVGPAPEQADGPHPHYADLTPDGRLVVCDLGTDRVSLYDVSDTGQLTAVSQLQLPAGYGPRHIVFDATKGVAYLVGELSSHVATLDYDAQAGTLALKQLTHLIPTTWTSHNGAAAIRLSEDGQYVYVSNRGFNGITVLQSNAAGELTTVQRISTEGDFPRDFNWTADQSLVIAVNQNTDNATLYRRDAQSGQLTLIEKDFAIPEGVSVLPAR